MMGTTHQRKPCRPWGCRPRGQKKSDG